MQKKVNIGLADKVHARAKVIATMKNTSLAKYLAEAIEKAVSEDKDLLEEFLK